MLFETAVVGSFPRPLYVQELLANKENTKNFDTHIERAVPFVVKIQEFAGIDHVSDGEWRRLSYLGVIADLLSGFKRELKKGLWWHTVTEKLSVKNKQLFAREAEFVKRHTERHVKVALPSPFTLGQRMWSEESRKAYATREEFMEALVPFLREEVKSLKGIASIVQIDDPNLCMFVDEDYRKKFENPEEQCELAAKLTNEVFHGTGVKSGVHFCRSSGTRNRGKKTDSDFVASGGYEYVLPFLKKINADYLFMEFSAPGSGEYTVLQELKQGIGVGCVDCTKGVIDPPEKIVERIEKAMQFTDKERIILNPDCGFAPGNQAPISIDEAFTKLQNMSKASAILREKY